MRWNQHLLMLAVVTAVVAGVVFALHPLLELVARRPRGGAASRPAPDSALPEFGAGALLSRAYLDRDGTTVNFLPIGEIIISGIVSEVRPHVENNPQDQAGGHWTVALVDGPGEPDRRAVQVRLRGRPAVRIGERARFRGRAAALDLSAFRSDPEVNLEDARLAE